MSRLAVVLFNLGGPDCQESVRPFLFNLFNDRAIIGLSQPFRWLLAQLISRRRAPTAQEIYRHIGGKSPLLDFTKAQASELKSCLLGITEDVEVFVCMRYWHPRASEVVKSVKAYDPDKVVLLPLYPQHSTTTTLSSFAEWNQAAKKAGLVKQTHRICCYPDNIGLIEAHADLVSKVLDRTRTNVRILFSAHGLPRNIVDKGDPYQWQIERTAAAIVDTMGGDIDWVVCYQSRVGPQEWIGPSTEEELARAAKDDVGVIVVPIAFVSDHSETLVELDIEYKDQAKELGISVYERVSALSVHPKFIGGLGALVRNACEKSPVRPHGGLSGERICPLEFGKCPLL